MTHTTEQERAEFEAHFKHLDLTQEPDAWGVPRYKHDAISLAWDAWQASRRAPQGVPQGWKMVPVGWQFYEDGKWWNGDDRIKDHRKNTEEARYPIRDVYAVEQQSAPPPSQQHRKAGATAAAQTTAVAVAPQRLPRLTGSTAND